MSNQPNCPFYGRHLFNTSLIQRGTPFTLMDSRGNQCALVTGTYSPCYLELEGREVNWQDCKRVAELTPGR